LVGHTNLDQQTAPAQAFHGSALTRPDLGFRLVALSAALAAWALVAVGGVVRVTQSGLGCPHWPLCTSKALPVDQTASFIEYSHRAVVALVIVLVVAVAIRAWRRYRSRPGILWPALGAVVLVPFQALLGAVAVWLELPGWVVAFHFVVGMLFLALLVVVAAAAWRGRTLSPTPGFANLARASALVGLALVSVGAAVVAAGADTACGTQWPSCKGTFVAGGSHAAIQVSHRMLAYTVAALAAWLLVLAVRGKGPRLAGSLPFLAVLVQMGFGIGIVLAGGGGRLHEILAGLHVGGAAAVWASLVALATLARPAPRLSAQKPEARSNRIRSDGRREDALRMPRDSGSSLAAGANDRCRSGSPR
jgi:heme A synthase